MPYRSTQTQSPTIFTTDFVDPITELITTIEDSETTSADYSASTTDLQTTVLPENRQTTSVLTTTQEIPTSTLAPVTDSVTNPEEYVLPGDESDDSDDSEDYSSTID